MQPFTLLIKPSGSDCNIDCRYCFYKDRSPQYGRGKQRMSDEVLAKLVKDYMQLGFPVAGFAWQGGEPTLMGVDFFKRAVELQKEYGTPGQQVSNTLQTNAVLLDEKWCRFFHDNKFLLGISIDGPKEFHDRYRVDRGGAGTFDRVMRGIGNCKKHHVEFSALVLLNNHNVRQPERLFDFLIEDDMTYVQFIPCVETDPRRFASPATSSDDESRGGWQKRSSGGKVADFSITPQQYGEFLCKMFDLWHDHGPEKVNIRDFDSIVTYFVLDNHTICTYNRLCAGFVVIEHTGEAFCCEFFVEPQWRIGNLLNTPLEQLAKSRKNRQFAQLKKNLPGKCLVCQHLDICRGGCLKDRVRCTGATSGQNYFCESYKQFFDYSLPRFMQIAAAIRAGTAERHTRSAETIRLRI